MHEACVFDSCVGLHYFVFFLFKQSHPLVGELFSVASEIPLDSLQFPLLILARMTDENVVRGLGVGEGRGSDGRAELVFGLRDCSFEGRIFEIVVVVKDASVVVVD